MTSEAFLNLDIIDGNVVYQESPLRLSTGDSDDNSEKESIFPDVLSAGTAALAKGRRIEIRRSLRQDICPSTPPPLVVSSSTLNETVQMGISKRTDFPLIQRKTALLIIDVQKYCCETMDATDYYRHESLPRMIKNIKALLDCFRTCRDRFESGARGQSPGCEVIFTIIQSMTRDARDISTDYKLSGPGFSNIPTIDTRREEIFLPAIEPDSKRGAGDICIPKTSCSVFMSTNIAYVLRNLLVEQLVVCGQLTEQCVESAVRDAADLGFFVSVVEDACATHSMDRHTQGLKGMKGFCRIISTSEAMKELLSSSSNDPALSESTSNEVRRRCSI